MSSNCENPQSAIIINKLERTTERVMTPGTLLGVRFCVNLAADSETNMTIVMNVIALTKRNSGGYVKISMIVSTSEELPTVHRKSSDRNTSTKVYSSYSPPSQATMLRSRSVGKTALRMSSKYCSKDLSLASQARERPCSPGRRS